MDWLRILEFYCDARELEREEALFQAKLAGAKIRLR